MSRAKSPRSDSLTCPFYNLSRVDHIECGHFRLTRVKDVKQHLLRKHAATISDDQRSELSKRMNGGLGEETHSWFSIWSILFPDELPPSSPFVASGVEEAISTVCDLWRKKSSKVLTSLALEREGLAQDTWLANRPIDQEQTEHTIDETMPGATGYLMIRLLDTLTKVTIHPSDR